jgi:3-hydroxybutyryl-CoA dehydrogenase
MLTPRRAPGEADPGEAGTAADAGFATAAVVGAGLMGHRIAGILAGGGLAVRLTDARPDVLDGATPAAGELAAERAVRRAPGPVTAVADLAEAVRGVDLVIEAVVENLTVKQELFARLDSLAPGAVLATNTSVLPVTAIAERVRDAGRVVGTHWWNPPDLIPVVEVVPGERTDPAIPERVITLLRALGKRPVLVRRDVPGFVGNRLQHALWREAIALVDEGIADAETVDLVVRNTIGLRLGCMGPIENADYVGLDLTLAIHEAVLPGLERSTEPSPLLRRLVAAGRLGAKTGSGLLAWPDGARQATAVRLSEHVRNQLRPNG